MKKTKKFITFLMLISVISSFISPLCVNALTSGEVYNYITNTKTTYNNVKSKIEQSKLEENYEINNQFKFAIDLLEKDITKYNNKLIENETLLDNNISLKYLIDNYFSTKKEEFELNYEDDILINVNSLEDIIYVKDELTYTLLTKEEISNVLINNYFKELNDNIISYNNNYSDKVTLYENTYTNLNLKIESEKEEINNIKTQINNYKTAEEALNNNPNMLINDKDVITLLDEYLTKLDLINITIDNYDTLENELNNILNEYKNIYDKFKNNNKNYIELELEKEINELDEKYSLINSNLDKTNYYNLNNIDNLNSLVNLEDEYEKLIIKINSYLQRRPSDTLSINNLFTNIKKIRLTLNKENSINYLLKMVENNDITIEDNVDKLYKLLNFDYINDEIKNKIISTKLSFYEFGFIDETKYSYEINKNLLFLNNLLIFDKDDFINNISYVYNYNVKEENNIISLTLYDKNNNIINTYLVILKADINSDYILDEKDLDMFKDKLLNKEELSELDLINLDLNNDLEIDLNDIVILNDKINNNSLVGETKEALYVITKIKEDDKIYYTISLKTDGLVKGILFDLTISNNLEFDSITYLNDKLNINDINNPTKLIGVENFTDNEKLITICYTDTKNMEEDIIFTIKESNTYLDSNELININEITSVIPKTVIEKEKDQENTNVIYVDNYVNNDNQISNNEQKKDEQIIDNNKDEIDNKEETDNNLFPNIIKIVIIVLLGTLIVYFMNKNEKDEELDFEGENKNKDE